MAKKKRQGHYCYVCGEHKANEKFSGRGHARHICKECDALPQEKKNELQYIARIDRIAGKYPRSKADWELLRKYANNTKYPEAREFARFVLGWDSADGSTGDNGEDMQWNEDIDVLPFTDMDDE